VVTCKVASKELQLKEPVQFRRGKTFHKKIQTEWINDAEGDVTIERSITKPNGRKGRVDVLVNQNQPMVAIVEIKSSNWDALTDAALRQNIRRHVRQIWHYIDSQLSESKDVCPGVILQKRPSEKERLKLIENLFNEEGIQVVWDDETIEECKIRLNEE
jgi:Holliday junction resolvase-like predicted endonuclease